MIFFIVAGFVRGTEMRYPLVAVLSVFLSVVGQAGNAVARDVSPEIIGNCRLGLELKPGQGCALPGEGSFSIGKDECKLVTSSGGGAVTMSEMSMLVSSRCELADGAYAASQVSADPPAWRIDSLPRGQESVGKCRVGLELKPGQSCAVPERGSFGIREDGCVGDTPSISGGVSMSDVSMSAASLCIKGKWGKGAFAASRISADPLTWRIDSLPTGEAN